MARVGKELLIVCSRCPYPPVSGDRLRHWHLLSGLARQWDLVGCIPVDEPPSAEVQTALRNVFREVAFLPAAKGRPRKAGDLVGAVPFWIGKRWSRQALVEVSRLAQSGQYAAAVLMGAEGSVCCRSLTSLGLPVVHEHMDAFYPECFQSIRGARTAASKAWALLEAVKTVLYEQQVLGHATVTTVVSKAERRSLLRLRPSADIRVVPCAIPLPKRSHLRDQSEAPHTIIATGTWSYFSNVDGMVWFVRRVMPKIVECVSKVRLEIVGRAPSREILRLAGTHVQVVGEVPDMTPFLEKASVVVAPIRIGTGVRVKVLEAMSHGKAVVCTPAALRGIPAKHGVHCRAAREEHGFAREVSALLQDRKLRRRFGQAARAMVRERFSPEGSGRAMEEAIRVAIARRGFS